MTLPGCLSSCGNVSIPYPFGIGKGCYGDKAFEILCKTREANGTSSSTMAPFLAVTGSRIVELSLVRLRIRGPVTFNCYDGKSGKGKGDILGGRNTALDLSTSPFTFSNKQNKLFAVGCDIFSYISDPDSSNYISGCASLCNSKTMNRDLMNASCFGIGCCQTTIPRGLKTFKLKVDSINTQTRSWDSDSNGCSFAALHDGDPFDLYSNGTLGTMVTALNYTSRTSTVALDWAIGYESNSYGSCDLMAMTQSEIDECKIRNPCDKRAICTNTLGSFYCECPPGYFGNGIKGRFGCFTVDYDHGKSKSSKAAVVLIGMKMMPIAIFTYLISLFG
ncbi:Wall-associated receptor kinase-like [Thalictrum thalictroides]|uniref:Wall-associated receptor kinase-like n=1 Tax=Thalictrum thalictroides TaxID=46969 RepID=A0A7J6VTC7_THATH|nr:Wall-associated receptor kinase-like [Thalictrum thalictroides]